MDPNEFGETVYPQIEQTKLDWLFKPIWADHTDFQSCELSTFRAAVWKNNTKYLCGVFDPSSMAVTIFHAYPFETLEEAKASSLDLAASYSKSRFREDPAADIELEALLALKAKRDSGSTEH